MHHIAEKGFGSQTDAYERSRPSYPKEAIDLIEKELFNSFSSGNSIIELGAGTGKMTRLLTARGANVTAIEPVEGMRKKFQEILPEVKVLKGTADSIPLPDESADGVIAAQAFHWFATDAALREIHRVLKRGGVLCLVWNLMDDPNIPVKSPMLEKYNDGAVPSYRGGSWRRVFDTPLSKSLFDSGTNISSPSTSFPAQLNHGRFSYTHKDCDEATVWGRVVSKSFISCKSAEEQSAIREEVLAFLRQNYPGLPKSFGPGSPGTIDLHYTTDVFWCRKL